MAPTYKLTYFSIRGLGEILRLLLKTGNIDFEDEHISYEDWPKLKESTPFGALPVLTIDGKQHHQHLALARFLGKEAKLAGANDFENLDIDIIADTVNDLKTKTFNYLIEKNKIGNEALKTTFFDETLPYYLERLDKIAKENDGYLACKRLTWVDIYFTGMYDCIVAMVGKDTIDKYPNLNDVRKNVTEVPKIKEWINVRPKMDVIRSIENKMSK